MKHIFPIGAVDYLQYSAVALPYGPPSDSISLLC